MNNVTPSSRATSLETILKKVNVSVGVILVIYYLGLLIFQAGKGTVEVLGLFAIGVLLAIPINIFLAVKYWERDQVEALYVYIVGQCLLPMPFLFLILLIQ